MKPLLHVTPQTPPAVCGLGDYAATVSARVQQVRPDIRCVYLAADPRRAIVQTRNRKAEWFWQQALRLLGSSSGPIVLHYSGYGYDPNGAPSWLADALEKRPPELHNVRVVTFFHELFATGWPWERSFWLSKSQRRVAARVALASDTLLTNRAASAAWLESTTGRPIGSVPHLPVPSNVGEPESVCPLIDRPPQAAIFGGAKRKEAFLAGRGAHRTAEICNRFGLTRLVDIGAKCHPDQKTFQTAGIELVEAGYVPKDEVSRILMQSRVGLVSYFAGYLEKSGVFAALTSHGVAVLGDDRTESEVAALLGVREHPTSDSELTNRAERGLAWSKTGHSLVHAQALLQACLENAVV